jgi:uncharacterized membrane protein
MTARERHLALAVAVGAALAPLLVLAMPYAVWCVVVLAALVGWLP